MNRLILCIIVALLIVTTAEPARAINIPGDASYYNIVNGEYVLKQDVTEMITITSNDITLDGNEKKVIGPVNGLGHGIYLLSRTGVTIKNVTVKNCQRGIVLINSNGNTITNNTTQSNTYAGINLYGSDDNEITDNTTLDNLYGILLQAYSDLNTLTGNTVGDTELGNTNGIYFQSHSNYNEIYNNNFIGNDTQAFVDASSIDNVFYLDIPIGGNHWSDWTTPDADGDCLVDNPYIIYEDENTSVLVQDEYPWAYQDGWLVGTVTLEVDIDIKPDSYPNTINLDSNGVVPVAILSSADFDATTVDPDTVALAGAGVAVRGKGTNYLTTERDVNGDGLIDLEVKVETENLNPGEIQDGEAILTGNLLSGGCFVIEGSDSITIVPPE